MDYTTIKFGFDVLISVVFGAGGALAVWFKLKSNVDLQCVELVNLKNELAELKEEKKESNKQTHRRIDSLKLIVDKNREITDNSVATMTAKMQEMELRIIKAIHEIK